MYKALKKRGVAASDYYAGREEYFTLSPAGITLLKGLEPVLLEYCCGRVLDAGAGRGAYRKILLQHADSYVGIDMQANPAVDTVGDIQSLPFGESSFDTVFCSQVLEHVPDPLKTLEEFRRVLRPGGTLILSVPHICWLHNEPNDYFRFTVYGLDFLLERAGLDHLRRFPAGGLVSLWGHIVSTFLINFTFGIPVLHEATKCLNRGFATIVSKMDMRVEKKKIFALNLISVSRKVE